jgi:transposase
MILPGMRRIAGKRDSAQVHPRPICCRPGCKSKEELDRLREQVVRRNQRIVELEGQVEEQQKKIADLERQLALRRRNSRNSSKPPSSDGLAGAERERGCGQRKAGKRRHPGGQKGHPGHFRPLVPPERVDHVTEVFPDRCGHCQEALSANAKTRVTEGEPWRHQVAELPVIQAEITEYQMHEVVCPCCGKSTRAPLPAEVRGQFGPRLTAAMALMTVLCHIPRRPLQCLLEKVLGIDVSLGTLQNSWEQASAAVAEPYKELEEALPQQWVLNCDETSSRTNKEKRWLWVLVAQSFVFFTIEVSRGTEVLRRLLGDQFAGILGNDRMASYVKYAKENAKALMQFCWAHFKRDLLGAQEVARSDEGKRFCRQALGYRRKLFRLWHRFSDQTSVRGSPPLPRKQLVKKALPIQKKLLALAEDNLDCPDAEVANLATALFEHHEKFFVFLDHKGVEPTNNVSERTVRTAVQWRKISFGNRSREGELAVARLLTVHGTCKLRHRDALLFLTEAIQSYRTGLPAPSLLR